MSLLLLGSGVDQEAGTAQLGGHIRQFEGDPLLEAHGLAELDPLLGVGQGVLIGPLGNPQGLGRHADAAAVQGGHGDLKALASSPSRLSAGTSTLSKISSAVVEERMPILS